MTIEIDFSIRDELASGVQEEQSLEDVQPFQLHSTTLPGYETFLNHLMDLLQLKPPIAPSGILVSGCPGVGKTKLLQCVASKMTQSKSTSSLSSSSIHWVNTTDLVLLASTAATLDDLIQNILPKSSCSLLILDELHILEQEDQSDEMPIDVEQRWVRNAITQAIDIIAAQGSCSVVGIAQEATMLPLEFTKAGRLEKELAMQPPTQWQRTQMWESLLHSKERHHTSWASALGAATAGCVAADLVRILQDATTKSWANKNHSTTGEQVEGITWDHIRDAAQNCVPSQLRLLDVRKPAMISDGRKSWLDIYNECWNDKIVGYPLIQKRVYRHVVAPWRRFLKHMEQSPNENQDAAIGKERQSHVLSPPPGVLFHGPPGCGKTLAATCLASSLELPVIQVRAADVLDKWLGSSEKILRSIFARARAAAPCILFMDEIDSLASNRAEDDTNDYTSRILSTFLNEMDGVSSSLKSRVLVVACTNRLEALDSALLRPGRLEEHFHLEAPSRDDLATMLDVRLNSMPLDSDVNLEDIADSLFANQASGADVEGLCREVCLKALRTKSTSADIDSVAIKQAHFLSVLG